MRQMAEIIHSIRPRARKEAGEPRGDERALKCVCAHIVSKKRQSWNTWRRHSEI